MQIYKYKTSYDSDDSVGCFVGITFRNGIKIRLSISTIKRLIKKLNKMLSEEDRIF